VIRIGRGLRVLVAAAVLLFTGVALSGAEAMTTAGEQTLYRFCPQSGCADGANPKAGVIVDAAGNLYGTTYRGGSHGFGTVFKLAPTAAGWTETVLYNFCEQTGCVDGYHPNAGVIMDGAGNLYGTAEGGGKPLSGGQAGVVFKLAPTGGGWTQTVLYSFCSTIFCHDGDTPRGGLIMDGGGNLYGTTIYGGSGSALGTVFKLAPDGSETVLHSFCSQSGCADGYYPQSSLIMDGAGKPLRDGQLGR
jgi:uncharacterized repeat protein (TIGR03803 family)